MVVPARLSWVPIPTLATGIVDQGLDLLGGCCCVGPGRAFAGHHGKPTALFPARAASTAAFSARMLV